MAASPWLLLAGFAVAALSAAEMTHATRRRPGAVRLAVGLLGAAIVIGGSVVVYRDQSRPSFAAEGEVPAADPKPTPATVTPQPKASPPPAAQDIGALVDQSISPTRLIMTNPRVDSPVVAVSASADRVLEIPEDPQTIGWWSGGAAPGSPVGTVVLTGHVARKSGPGALLKLAETRVGSTITIAGRTGEKPVKYVVKARQSYLKTVLPWESLFAQGMQPRLIIITCGGEVDPTSGRYDSNVVVAATPIG